MSYIHQLKAFSVRSQIFNNSPLVGIDNNYGLVNHINMIQLMNRWNLNMDQRIAYNMFFREENNNYWDTKMIPLGYITHKYLNQHGILNKDIQPLFFELGCKKCKNITMCHKCNIKYCDNCNQHNC